MTNRAADFCAYTPADVLLRTMCAHVLRTIRGEAAFVRARHVITAATVIKTG
ncbi:MAG: hypothetical protein ACYYKD_00155 [Rhodospirillales bacterium]